VVHKTSFSALLTAEILPSDPAVLLFTKFDAENNGMDSTPKQKTRTPKQVVSKYSFNYSVSGLCIFATYHRPTAG